MSKGEKNARPQTVSTWKWGLLAASVLLPVSCAETQLFSHATKQITRSEPKVSGYKIGDPYRIGGTWYYPHEDYSYRETGVASWYGPTFHGKFTANGEVFNQDELTAAHRTLPLPSFVRVTNLENGRTVVLRVNDRGPFAHNRVIDVSKRGAQLLGFDTQGTAKVKVEVMAQESRAMKEQLIREATLGKDAPLPQPSGETVAEGDPSPPPYTDEAPVDPVVTTQTLEEPSPPPAKDDLFTTASVEPPPPAVVPPPAPAPVVVPPPAPVGSGYFIQAASFSSYDNAQRTVQLLQSVAPASAVPTTVDGRQLYRVRVGPVSPAEVQSVLERVQASGYPDARLAK